MNPPEHVRQAAAAAPAVAAAAEALAAAALAAACLGLFSLTAHEGAASDLLSRPSVVKARSSPPFPLVARTKNSKHLICHDVPLCVHFFFAAAAVSLSRTVKAAGGAGKPQTQTGNKQHLIHPRRCETKEQQTARDISRTETDEERHAEPKKKKTHVGTRTGGYSGARGRPTLRLSFYPFSARVPAPAAAGVHQHGRRKTICVSQAGQVRGADAGEQGMGRAGGQAGRRNASAHFMGLAPAKRSTT